MRRSFVGYRPWLTAVLVLLALGIPTWGPAPRGAVAAVAAPSAAGATMATIPASQVTTLRFGSPGSVSDAGVFIARAQGYFRQQGIEVDVVPFQSGADTIAPLASGELDVSGGITSIALLNAAERGLGIKVVADKGTSRPGFEFSWLAVRRDLVESGAVRDLADLRGRRVGIAASRSGAEAVVAHVLARGGVRLDEVNLTVLGFPEMVVAFGNGAIDPANMIEPMLGVAMERGVIAPWEPGCNSAGYGGVYQSGVLLYSGRLAAQTDLARRFMVAYLQGVRASNDAFARGEGRADIVRILTEQTTVKDPAMYDRMQLAGLDPDGRLARECLQYDLDFFREQGYYTGPVTFDNLIDTSFAEYAAQQLGPYR
jgi:NitT/TauT family transport system substrate-binding protein